MIKLKWSLKSQNKWVRLVRKTMLIPLDTSILYVEPIYQIYLNENAVPVLKAVVVASGSRVEWKHSSRGCGKSFRCNN